MSNNQEQQQQEQPKMNERKQGTRESSAPKNSLGTKMKNGTKTAAAYLGTGIMYISGSAVIFGVGFAAFTYVGAALSLNFWATLGVVALAGLVGALLCGAIRVKMPKFVQNAGENLRGAVNRQKAAA